MSLKEPHLLLTASELGFSFIFVQGATNQEIQYREDPFSGWIFQRVLLVKYDLAESYCCHMTSLQKVV